MSSKITIIGAGSVGSTIAYTLAHDEIASEIVLIDINKEKVAGEVAGGKALRRRQWGQDPGEVLRSD